MDNLTHSLSGALAAKLIKPIDRIDDRKQRRVLFYLLVLCANLPDIDVLIGVFTDPVFSLQHHRGITHSFIFAPIFALLPAAVFFRFSSVKNLKALWLVGFIGIIIHIFFDLITAFGTQIFSPFSNMRYSLDWMFIVDPLFTGVMAVGLLLQKIFSSKKKFVVMAMSMFVAGYIGVEMISHHIALNRVEEELDRERIRATTISALPQPLSVFRWAGVVQTDDGVQQTFFSLLSDDSLTFAEYRNADDAFVAKAMQTKDAQWYSSFARHPWITSTDDGKEHIVEIRDMQFTIDSRLIRWLGMTERPVPFVLRFEFSEDGNLFNISFNGRTISRKSDFERSE